MRTLQIDLTRLEKSSGRGGRHYPEQVTAILEDFATLLDNAASGKLGEDMVYKAFRVFRRLTGGRIWVHVERRPGRKRTNVRGVFYSTVAAGCGGRDGHFSASATTVRPRKCQCGSANRRSLTPLAERAHD